MGSRASVLHTSFSSSILSASSHQASSLLPSAPPQQAPPCSPFVHGEVFLSEAHGIQLLSLKTLLWLPVASGMESCPCKPGGFPPIFMAPCNAHHLCWSECVSLLKALAQFLLGNDSPEPPCLTDSGLECSVPTYLVRLSCIVPLALWENWLLP